MNVIIPMAGEGSRFSNAGYQKPKPFIPIKGRAMIEWVVDNVSGPDDTVYLLSRLDHLPHLRDTNILSRNNVCIVPVLNKTEGALCTVLLAEKFIDNSEPLLIANSDQYIKYDKEGWLKTCYGSDGCIMVFKSDEYKWSYAKLNDKGLVERVAEKNPISEWATVGMYYFQQGDWFVHCAKKLIEANDRVNGEFYVVPVYNYLLENIWGDYCTDKVRVFEVDKMYGMGTPEDLEKNYDKIGN